MPCPPPAGPSCHPVLESSHPSPSIMSFWRVDALVNAKSNGPRPGHGIAMATGDIYCYKQKETLMSLNTRLEAYLEKVQMLEESNQQLEEKIKAVSKIQKVDRDHSRYQKTIEDLESQIRRARQANCNLWLKIENTKKTADGYKERYEAEKALQKVITDDIKKLKATNSGFEMEKRCLEAEVKILTEELENLKTDHKEEMEHLLQAKSKCRVNVEMDPLNTTELSHSLEKMRQWYTDIANNHQKQYEALLVEKVKGSTQKSSPDTELFNSQMRHLSLLRRTVQDLETEREVQYSLKIAQEEALHETEANYITQLEHIQEVVLRLEDMLERVRSESESLTSDCRILCYLKDLLEMEIRTYDLLMDSGENRIEDVLSESSPTVAHNRQMFLFMISESMSVISKNPPYEGLSSRHPQRARKTN